MKIIKLIELPILFLVLCFVLAPINVQANINDLYGNTLECIGAHLKGNEDWGAWANFYVSKNQRVFKTGGIYEFPKRKKHKQEGQLMGNVLQFGEVINERHTQDGATFKSEAYSGKNSKGFQYTINIDVENWAFYSYRPAQIQKKGHVYKQDGKWVYIEETRQTIVGARAAVPYKKSHYSCVLKHGRTIDTHD